MSHVTFEKKETYKVDDIAYCHNLTPFMRCVGADEKGRPLFRMITDVSELAAPATGIIATSVCDVGRHFGSPHYDLFIQYIDTHASYIEGEENKWDCVNNESGLTMEEVLMRSHNLTRPYSGRNVPHYKTKIIDKNDGSEVFLSRK